jgi:hypothetical protein
MGVAKTSTLPDPISLAAWALSTTIVCFAETYPGITKSIVSPLSSYVLE